jgi:DNA-binding transcriptional MerR regulator
MSRRALAQAYLDGNNSIYNSNNSIYNGNNSSHNSNNSSNNGNNSSNNGNKSNYNGNKSSYDGQMWSYHGNKWGFSHPLRLIQEAMKKPPRSPHRAQDLAAAGGISKRTLTRWFAHGILGQPPRRGPSAGYSAEQILRARAAAMLRHDIVSLDEICRRLDGATQAELEVWAKTGLSSETSEGAGSSAVAPYPAARYEHVELAPGLTLLVRDDCDPAVRRRAQDIYASYGPSRR